MEYIVLGVPDIVSEEVLKELLWDGFYNVISDIQKEEKILGKKADYAIIQDGMRTIGYKEKDFDMKSCFTSILNKSLKLGSNFKDDTMNGVVLHFDYINVNKQYKDDIKIAFMVYTGNSTYATIFDISTLDVLYDEIGNGDILECVKYILKNYFLKQDLYALTIDLLECKGNTSLTVDNDMYVGYSRIPSVYDRSILKDESYADKKSMSVVIDNR